MACGDIYEVKFYLNLGLRYNSYRYGIEDSILISSDSGLVTNNTIIDSTFLEKLIKFHSKK